MTKQTIGARGEALAAAHLHNQQYEIIEQNWHCQRGEIDIVARQDDIWIFCEVKTRQTTTIQPAFANITAAKHERMILAAQTYLSEHELEDALWRIDAIAVALPRHGKPIIEHVEDVLDW